MIKYQCKRHGNVMAYCYRLKTASGPQAGQMRWKRTCTKCRSEEIKKQWQKIKSETISAYGGKCSCCGESEPKFMTIDHMRGDGWKHRKEVGRGWRLYQWLAKRGYPKDEYRLLCFNCNCSRGQFGKCPHEERK